MSEYLTAEEIAAQLRVSSKTVREWCRSKKLKSIRAGKQWRIKASDLEAFLNPTEAQEEQPKKADGLVAFATRPLSPTTP